MNINMLLASYVKLESSIKCLVHLIKIVEVDKGLILNIYFAFTIS
jgi:hypothetical protein